jgi:hypothetical protein
MKLRKFVLLGLIVLPVPGGWADIPPVGLADAIRQRQQTMQIKFARQITNVLQSAQEMVNAYDALHPQDLKLEFFSLKQLRRLVEARTNDLVPRLMLLCNSLADDEECRLWFATLNEGYALCTNEEQRVTCLAMAAVAVFGLEAKQFGKGMLGDLKEWLKQLSSQKPTPAIAVRIQYLHLFAALATEAYADVQVYAKGTPFRTLSPLWMMSKRQWELALEEVRKLKTLSDLESDEKSALDVFERVLEGVLEKKPEKP